MSSKKILILGASSFVAKGLYEVLTDRNYTVHRFKRGDIGQKDELIMGDVYRLSENPYLSENYDTVINFIVIKDGDNQKNIKYIQSVLDFCKSHRVKQLIHFSSIMVYNYGLKDVDEQTAIETLDETTKKGYGEFKICVDQYLMKQRKSLPFELIMVRPGYVLADNRPCPFIKGLPFGINLIKGNRQSKQPIVRRSDIHLALVRIIENDCNDAVYHFFPNNDMTKYRYAKQTRKGIILIMPKWLFKSIPHWLSLIGIMPESLYSRFEGMYIESKFSSRRTEEKLKITFK